MTTAFKLLVLALLAAIVGLGLWAQFTGEADDTQSPAADLAAGLTVALMLVALIGLAS